MTIVPLFPERGHRSSWYCIPLSESQLLDAAHEPIASAFEQAYVDAGEPVAMSLWLAYWPEGGGRLYLSPASIRASADLIDGYDAEPCRPPSRPPHRLVVKIAGRRESAS